MNTCYFCWTSSPNAISDGFSDLQEELSTNESCFFSGSVHSISADGSRLHLARYGTHRYHLFDLLRDIHNFRKFLRNNHISYLFVFSSSPIYGLLPYLIPRSIKIGFWIHDPMVHSGERFRVSLLKSLADRLLTLSSKVDAVFLAGEFLRSQVAKTPFRKLSQVVIPLAYSKKLVHPGRTNEFNKQKGRIIFFGRIEKYKGIDWFLNALQKHGSPLSKFGVQIIIAGRGKVDFPVEALAVGIDVILDNRYIPNDELSQMISSSEIAIFPYRDATGTCAIQTAGALGCKIVATSVGTLPDLLISPYSKAVDPQDPEGFISAIANLLNSDYDPRSISSSYDAQFSPATFANSLATNIER